MFRKPPAEIRENRKAESDQIYKFKKIEKPPPFGLRDDALTFQPTEPHQPGKEALHTCL